MVLIGSLVGSLDLLAAHEPIDVPVQIQEHDRVVRSPEGRSQLEARPPNCASGHQYQHRKLRKAISGQRVDGSVILGPKRRDPVLTEAGMRSHGIASNEVVIESAAPHNDQGVIGELLGPDR
jgi:hypothetical protein